MSCSSDRRPSVGGSFEETPEVSPGHVADSLRGISMRFDAARHAVVLAIAVLAVRGVWGPEPNLFAKLSMIALLVSALLGVFHFWWVARLATGVAATGWGRPDPGLPRAQDLVGRFGNAQMVLLVMGLLGLGLAFIFR